MINPMPILQRPTSKLFFQQPADNSLKLAPPLLVNNDATMEGTARPWRVTPPLKKRHVQIDVNAIKIQPLKAKKTLVKRSKIGAGKSRSVRFSKVFKSRTLKKERLNLTAEARQAMWYGNREYAEMDQDNLKNIQALHQVHGDLARLPPRDYCLRGLEMKTSAHIHRLRRLRAAITVRAVLDQQRYQRRLLGPGCVLVGEAMAMTSRRYTQQAKIRARELGLIDSIEASR